MEQTFAEIARAARILGLGPRDPKVTEAREVAIAAIQDGYSQDEAYEFARPVLFPSRALVAA